MSTTMSAPPTGTARAFGDAIKRRCAEKGITQRALAKRLRMAPVSICRILNGTANPSLSTAEKMARAVGLNLEKIIRDCA